jgi:hypothetical protein
MIFIKQSDAFSADRPTVRPISPLATTISPRRSLLQGYNNISNLRTVLRAGNNDVCVDVVSFIL